MKKDFENYETLSFRWSTLTSKAIIERKFNREEFVSLFKKTFEKIKKYSIAPTIDRDIMDLVFSISGFVATRLVNISNEHTAATELVEAMIHCCLYEEPHENIIEKGEWYIFSNTSVDFTEPDKTLLDIAMAFEQWDNR